MYWLSHKESVCGIPVATLDSDDKTTCYPKIEAALALIRHHDPRRFERIRRDVRSIMLTGDSQDLGEWCDDLRMCQLARRYVASPMRTAADIAAEIVHEATHARLFRLGIGYEEPIRARVERICFNAEISFAKHLPDGTAVVERAQSQLERPTAFWSTSNFWRREFASLRRLGCPEWFVSALEWMGRRRAA